MKFSRILGVAAVVLLTTAAARQATAPAPVATPPGATQPTTASASAAPALPTATATATAPGTPTAPTAGAAQVTAVAEPTPAPVTALADAKPAGFGDPKAGQAKAGACAACHGLDGNSTDPQYPRLAGQHERYIWRQLRLFHSGERQNPMMTPMASPLSEQDMRDIGAFFSTQHSAAGVADDTVIKDGANAGKKFYQVGEALFRGGRTSDKVPGCIACHGPTGRGNPGPSYPALGGQHAGYTVARLQYFRGGGVSGAGANANIVMTDVAKNLSDEDIQGLATYIEGLHAATAPTATAKAE
jgi:cytochrome c553